MSVDIDESDLVWLTAAIKLAIESPYNNSTGIYRMIEVLGKIDRQTRPVNYHISERGE